MVGNSTVTITVIKQGIELMDHSQPSPTKTSYLSLPHRLTYVETSAATGQNVEVAVNHLLDAVMKRMAMAVDSSLLPGRRGRAKGLRATDEGGSEKNDNNCAC